jgi:hypothetical protein
LGRIYRVDAPKFMSVYGFQSRTLGLTHPRRFTRGVMGRITLSEQTFYPINS